MNSKNHGILSFCSGDIPKYVTVPQSKLEDLCTLLLQFKESVQNALYLC